MLRVDCCADMSVRRRDDALAGRPLRRPNQCAAGRGLLFRSFMNAARGRLDVQDRRPSSPRRASWTRCWRRSTECIRRSRGRRGGHKMRRVGGGRARRSGRSSTRPTSAYDAVRTSSGSSCHRVAGDSLSLSSVPPVCPSPPSDIIGTRRRKLPREPPSKCLDLVAHSRRSSALSFDPFTDGSRSTLPECSMASVSATVSRSSRRAGIRPISQAVICSRRPNLATNCSTNGAKSPALCGFFASRLLRITSTGVSLSLSSLHIERTTLMDTRGERRAQAHASSHSHRAAFDLLVARVLEKPHRAGISLLREI